MSESYTDLPRKQNHNALFRVKVGTTLQYHVALRLERLYGRIEGDHVELALNPQEVDDLIVLLTYYKKAGQGETQPRE